MKSFRQMITEKLKKTYRVTYDGRYSKVVSAHTEEEAIAKQDKSTKMQSKKKIMYFDYSKYKAIEL